MHYLRNSHDIKKQLGILFSGPGEKWAVVGFVGYNALDHLPSGVENLNVICWPKAGGTNPDGVRRLIDSGISVYFCDRLHQKIYWRQGVGLIVGSANLSENALGEGGLHEFGVYCDDTHFDINQVISALDYARVTPEALSKLDVEHAAYARQKENSNEGESNIDQSFLDSTKTRLPKQWKLVVWSELREDSTQIRAEIETHFGKRNWANDNDVDSDAFKVGDFVLQVKTNDEGIIERANARWLLVDHIVGKRNNRVIVQVHKIDNRTPPPFVIDSQFQKNLKHAFNATDDWNEIHDTDYSVLPAFVSSIRALYGDVV
ncbi:phospholipase D family protein [Undibacterium sp. FT79W]|uniref:phospholipase D family protein n=1 Tax=Undibacterium sp. FT79W TaxID=2762296 RepID=UPI00164AF97B|nr:phospholipase D family protein [Undibacterium sp. FT79W]MBC3879070.1 phospholipase D family protein [Undibacterium sp. FT79W]